MSAEIEEMLRLYAQHQDTQAPSVTVAEARARVAQSGAGNGAARAATGPNGSRPERTYLFEPPEREMVALARPRAPRRRAIAVLAAVAAVIVATVAVAVTRPSTHPRPAKTLTPPPSPTTVAQPQLYWSGPTGIGRANVNGRDAVPGLIPSTDFATYPHCGMAADRNYIYWTAEDRVVRVKRDGTDLEPKFIDLTGTPLACFLAVDDAHIYWGESGAGIGRANLDGTGVQRDFIRGASMYSCGIAVDSDHIYWADQGTSTISRANLDGTDVNRDFIAVTGPHPPPGLPPACGLLVDGAYIYWGTPDTIARANLDGTGVNNSFIGAPDLGSGEVPLVCAHDATYLYWADLELPGMSTAWVGRASLDGTDVQAHLMSVDHPFACAVEP